MTVSLPKAVSCSPDVLFRELDSEGVLLDLETERYYTLDDIGARMWQLLHEHEADTDPEVVERLRALGCAE